MTISRRDFLGGAAATAVGLAAGTATGAATASAASATQQEPEPTAAGRSAGTVTVGTRPVAIASGNGLQAVERALEGLQRGEDPLDAAVAGVEIQERDPEDHSVGLGGLPNADGVVQLDASCMHGPSRRAGAVGALEDVVTAARVAKAVMEHTDHIFLVGEGARRFALDLGFEKTDLLTPEARKIWLRWRSRLHPDDNWLDLGRLDSGRDGGEEDLPFTTGTINLNTVSPGGDLASVTTTSGLSWKIPGRVGDSPLIGAGQYCDNEIGAAGSTGRGEANIKVCGAFLTVEHMRAGASPEEACLRTLERVVEMTEPRLKDDLGHPRFQLSYYAVAKDGRYGAAALYERKDRQFAVADGIGGARHEPFAFLFREDERPRS